LTRQRLEVTLETLQAAGVPATGAVVDRDPYTAIMDQVESSDPPAEIIISTLPQTRSGWLRRDLVERVKQASRRPVEHVVVEHGDPGERGTETLVVANQTVEDDDLLKLLKDRAADGRHRFVLIMPQGEGAEGDPYARLAHVLRLLEEAGVDTVGQVVHPDPYTAIMNAVQFYPVDDIIISTFESGRSGWLRADLVGRVRSATGKPVEHVVAGGGQRSSTANEGQAA
ncbi:MAG: hypothetical protein QOH13_894, partial [Thermoleophilaceae bacterium]|nr:hypothetical protein [Thermoleophilaceae bacterium]